MYKKTLTFILIILAVLSFGGCQGRIANEPVPEEPILAWSARQLTRDLSAAGEAYGRVSCTILELASPQGEDVSLINAALAELMEQIIADIQASDDAEHGANPSIRFYHSRESALVYLDHDTISVLIDCYDEATSSAHAHAFYLAYTYDWRSGERKELNDYCGEDGMRQVAERIYQQIVGAGDRSAYNSNLKADLLRYLTTGKWYAESEGIVVIYNPYEIAGYTAGIMTFTVPYTL